MKFPATLAGDGVRLIALNAEGLDELVKIKIIYFFISLIARVSKRIHNFAKV